MRNIAALGLLAIVAFAQAPVKKAAPRAIQGATDPMYLQAENKWRQHDYEAANNLFKALVAANPQNPDYRARWGDLFLERFNPEEAFKLYAEALTINPAHAKANLGMARVLADRYEGKANENLQKALETDPTLYEAHELMATIALEDNNDAKAAAAADSALSINPDAKQATAIHAAIDLLNDKKQTPWLAKLGTDGAAYETVAHFFVINRRYEEGIEYYRKAIAASPDLYSAHSQLGINLMRLGREDEARKELELAYENHYRDAPTVNSLRLMDTYDRFVTYKTPTTILKLDKKEAEPLRPYVEGEMLRALATYEKKYKYHLNRPCAG